MARSNHDTDLAEMRDRADAEYYSGMADIARRHGGIRRDEMAEVIGDLATSNTLRDDPERVNRRRNTIDDAALGIAALQGFIYSLPGSDRDNIIADVRITAQPHQGRSAITARIVDHDGHRITWSVKHAR